MAEKKKNSNSNSNNTNLKFVINAQFLKDLSFENPQAPDSLRNIKGNPTFNIDADVKSRTLPDHGENIFDFPGPHLRIHSHFSSRCDFVCVRISYACEC